MKKLMYLMTFILAILVSTQDLNCQIRSILNRTRQVATEKINENIEKEIVNAIDPQEDPEEASKTGEQAVKQDAEVQVAKVEQAAGDQAVTEAASEAPKLVWSKYDFVPGDKIIFEDNLVGEENGEFPSRWDLDRGTTEIAVFGGENVIMMRGGSPAIIPYLKNSNIDYLPDVFTIEFDLYFPENTFQVYFYDRKNQSAPAGSSYLTIRPNRMEFSNSSSDIPNNETISNKWAHISIAYTSGTLKAYIDETRLINIPRLSFNPTGVTLYSYSANDNRLFYVKNVRIAEGGVEYYDRFIQDGKIVSNGIRFDVGKATLRPESMGVLNEIYKMLSDHPEIKVSIEGHTDSDGDTEINQKLSEERAITVMKQLESMGVSSDRLSSKGFGESTPFGPNDTPEGKAANRRVEFLKM